MDIVKELLTYLGALPQPIQISFGALIVLAVAAFFVGWRIKAAIVEGAMNGKQGQIAILEERLRLAQDKEKRTTVSFDELKLQIAELRDEILKSAPYPQLAQKADKARRIMDGLVTMYGKPVEYEDHGDVLVVWPPDGGPPAVVPSNPTRRGDRRS